MLSGNKKMKFSIIGTGFIFPAHAEAIRDIKGEIRDVVNDAHSSDAWKEMIKTTDADCIVVLTPNDLHFEMCKLAAENNKIVLCEKPMTLKPEQAEELSKMNNIFGVLQLRYHPDIVKLKEKIKTEEKNIVEMDISVYRDEKYYESWKGKPERSGGPLMNLGVHYFDLLIYLFGEPKKVLLEYLDDKTGKGTIEGDNYECKFTVSTGERQDNQRRVFKINGEQYNFSSKDNLSFENLHKFVYQDLLNGKGITPQEAEKAIKLVENIYQSFKK